MSRISIRMLITQHCKYNSSLHISITSYVRFLLQIKITNSLPGKKVEMFRKGSIEWLNKEVVTFICLERCSQGFYVHSS